MSKHNRSRYLEILKKYNKLMMEYEELLSVSEFSEEDFPNEVLFPLFPHRPLYIERQCAFMRESGEAQNFPMNLMVAPSEKAEGLTEISAFTRGSEELIIIDPYIFFKRSNIQEAIEDFKKSISLENTQDNNVCLRKVHFVYDPDRKNGAIYDAITETLQEKSIHFSEKPWDRLHDRIWISEHNGRKKAIVVGTSLNGIGNRLSFILPLPDRDLNDLYRFLVDNSLLNSQENRTN